MVSTPADLLDWGVAFLRDGAAGQDDLSLSRFQVAPNGTALGVIPWSINSGACIFGGECSTFDAVTGIGAFWSDQLDGRLLAPLGSHRRRFQQRRIRHAVRGRWARGRDHEVVGWRPMTFQATSRSDGGRGRGGAGRSKAAISRVRLRLRAISRWEKQINATCFAKPMLSVEDDAQRPARRRRSRLPSAPKISRITELQPVGLRGLP